MRSAVPTQADLSRCRSCHAVIVWAYTDRGRIMPVDAEPSEDGTLRLGRRDDGEIEVQVVDRSASVLRHHSHFVTCPHRDQWRRRR